MVKEKPPKKDNELLTRDEFFEELEYKDLPPRLVEEADQLADLRWKQKLRLETLLGMEVEQGLSKYIPHISLAVTVLLLLIVIIRH